MYISNKMVKMAGLFPSGKYDAEITKVEECFLSDLYEEEHKYWYFHFKIMEKSKCRQYVYCMECIEYPGSEFLEVMADLRQVMNKKAHEKIKAKDIVNLSVSVKLGCVVEISNPFIKEALMRNRILKIDKCHDDIKAV